MDKITPISDVVWFQEGPGVRNTQYTTEGVKLLNVANLVDGEVDLSNTNRYISEEEAYGKYKHFLVDEGDLIIASSGIKVDYFDKKMGFIKKEHLPLCMNTSTIRFKTLNADVLDIRYFMYFLKSESFKQQLAVQITGSAQLNFGPSHLKKMSVKMVPMAQQKEIVHNLSEIDRLISYRQQQLIKLDELVKSRFVELFGDVANSPKYSGVPLGTICSTLSGGTPTTKVPEYYQGDIPWISTPYLGNNHINGSSAKAYITEDAIQNSATHLIPANTIMFGIRVGVGKSSIIDEPMCANQDIVALMGIDTNKYNLLFVKHTLDSYQSHFDSIKKGATILGITTDDLKKVLIPNVDIGLQNQFAAFVEQTDKSKLAVQQSLEKLETLKKSLMQQYFEYNQRRII